MPFLGLPELITQSLEKLLMLVQEFYAPLKTWGCAPIGKLCDCFPQDRSSLGHAYDFICPGHIFNIESMLKKVEESAVSNNTVNMPDRAYYHFRFAEGFLSKLFLLFGDI